MASRNERKLVLSVGSTKHDALVQVAYDAVHDTRPALRLSSAVFQVGNSSVPLSSSHKDDWIDTSKFRDDIDEQIGSADIVIAHAGAGTCLSFIRPKPGARGSVPRVRALVLVPNDTLADSHQSELAHEMQHMFGAYVCRPEELKETLVALAKDLDERERTLKHEPVAKEDIAVLSEHKGPSKMQRILDETLGYPLAPP